MKRKRHMKHVPLHVRGTLTAVAEAARAHHVLRVVSMLRAMFPVATVSVGAETAEHDCITVKGLQRLGHADSLRMRNVSDDFSYTGSSSTVDVYVRKTDGMRYRTPSRVYLILDLFACLFMCLLLYLAVHSIIPAACPLPQILERMLPNLLAIDLNSVNTSRT